MKFEMLKKNKMKVTMNSKDLKEFGISFEAMAKNSPESREVFFELLRRAEKETGFDCNNSRLVVEAAIQAEKGEMTLFVTKVNSSEEEKLFDSLSEIIPEKRKEKKKEIHLPEGNMIELVDFEDVISMCSCMRECSWGTLYSYNNKYYMTMNPTYIPKASEFGTVCSKEYRTIVEEHGKAIVKNSAFIFIRNKFE